MINRERHQKTCRRPAPQIVLFVGAAKQPGPKNAQKLHIWGSAHSQEEEDVTEGPQPNLDLGLHRFSRGGHQPTE